MARIHSITIGGGIAALLLAAPIARAQTTITVQPWTKQTFQGFGGAWTSTGSYFIQCADNSSGGAQLKASAFDAVFSSLNLSFVRFPLQPEFQATQGAAYDWYDALEDGNWDTGTHDVQVIQAARARTSNAIKVMFTVWSPPAWMKSNDSTSGGGANNTLRSDMQSAYATYLTDFANGFSSRYQIPVNLLSIQNEPDLNTSYDSCVYTAGGLAQEINTVKSALNTSGNGTTQLIGPEPSSPQATDSSGATFYQTVLDNAGASLGTGAVHGYGPNMGVIPQSYRAKKPLFQSEFSFTGGASDGGAPMAAQMAQHFCQDANSGDASAWFWWNLLGPQDSSTGESLLLDDQQYSTNTVTKFWATTKYYAFQQLTWAVGSGDVSRWVDVSTGLNGNLSACAFRKPWGKWEVVVANAGSSAYANVQISINEMSTSGSAAFTQWLTDPSHVWYQNGTSTVSFSNGQATVNITPYSVYCFVQQ